MGKINDVKVIIGGLIAGAVLNIGEFVLNVVILKNAWTDVVQQHSLAADVSVLWWVLLYFALGIVAVWTYAAIRPRFAPGVKTAICAGLLVWFFVYLFCSAGALIMGLYPFGMIAVSVLWGLVEVPLATVAGAWLYKEE